MIFHNVAGTTSEEFSLGIKTKLIKFRTNNGIVEWANYGGNWNKIQKTKNDSVNPTVDDDVTLGYQVMDCWYNNVSKAYFICEDNTDGAAVWRAIGLNATGSRLLYVDKSRTDSYTADGTQEKPYLTVQAAVNKAETMTPSHSAPVVIRIAPGIYDETVTIKKDGVSLQGTVGQGSCRIQKTAGPSLVLTNATTASLATFFGNGGYADPMTNYGDLVADVTNPWDNQFRDVAFGTPAGGVGNAVMILGVGAGNSSCGNEACFMRCHIAQDVFARGINYLVFQNDCWVAGTVTTHNIAGLWASRVQLGGVSSSYNVANDEPSDTGNYGLSGSNALIYGNVNLSGSAQAGYDRLDGPQITGNVTLAGTSKFMAYKGHIGGNVVVAEGAQLDLYGTYIKGTSTFTAGAPNTPCTSVGGELVGAITDSGSRLTWSYKGASLVNPSTDHAIPRFNGTTGIMQNSGVTIDDSDNVTVPTGSTLITNGIRSILGNNLFIYNGSNDGADNKYTVLCGGGNAAITRGSLIQVNGNETGDVGSIQYWLGNATGSRHMFMKGDGTEAMRLTGDNGRLGIGTGATVSYPLHVKAAGAATPQIVAEDTTGIKVGLLASAATGYTYVGSVSNHPLVLMTNDSGRVIIATDGKTRFNNQVGIGVDADASWSLLASGNIRLAGQLDFNGSGSAYVGTLNNFPLLFYTNNLTKMTLSTAGYLGVGGNHAPGYPLHVKSDTTPQIVAENATAGIRSVLYSDGTSGNVGTATNHAMNYIYNGSTMFSTYWQSGYGDTIWFPKHIDFNFILPSSAGSGILANTVGYQSYGPTTIEMIGVSSTLTTRIPTGVVYNGSMIGLNAAGYRALDANDAATLPLLVGTRSGISSSFGVSASAVTTSAVCFYASTAIGYGYFTNTYDLYAAAVSGNANRITNQYGIYILGNAKKSLIEGSLMVGSTTAPGYPLHVKSSSDPAIMLEHGTTGNTMYWQAVDAATDYFRMQSPNAVDFRINMNNGTNGWCTFLRDGSFGVLHYGTVSTYSNTAMGTSEISTNLTNANGLGVSHQAQATSAGSYIWYGANINLYQCLTGGNNASSAYGLAITTLRNYQWSDGNYTLAGQFGERIAFGHSSATPSQDPQTTNSVGIWLWPACLTGDINTMVGLQISGGVVGTVGQPASSISTYYDIYAGDWNLVNGTITTKWGLYILGSTKNNLIEGKLMVGSTTTPSYPLHVKASDTSNHIVAESASGIKAGVWADASYSYAGAISDHDFVIKGSATGTKATWISAISRPYIKIVGDTLAGNSYPTEQGSIILRPGASNGNYNKISFRTGSDYEVFYMDYAGRFHFGTNLPAPSWLTPRARITVQDCTDDVQSAGAIYAFGKVDAAGTAARYNNGITGGVTGSIVPGYTNDTDWVGITGFYSRTGGVGVDTGTLTRASCIVASASPQAYAITTNLYMFKTYYYIYSGTNSVANCYDFYGAKYNIEAAVTNKWGIVIDCDDTTPKKSIIRGLVGIGNSTMTNPSYPLHVKSSTTPQIYVEYTGGAKASLWADNSNAYLTSGGAYPLLVHPGTSSGSDTSEVIIRGGSVSANVPFIDLLGMNYTSYEGVILSRYGTHANSAFIIKRGDANEVLKLDTSGNLVIGGTGTYQSTGEKVKIVTTMVNAAGYGLATYSMNAPDASSGTITYAQYGAWIAALPKILGTATNDGEHIGVIGTVIRNSGAVGSGDVGTLATGVGVLGEFKSNSSAGSTTAFSALRSRCTVASGTTLGTWYDFYGEDPTGAGTVSAKWGLYILGTKNNYFAAGNIGLGINTFGTSADKVLALGTGTAPSTSPADAFQMYSADITAGNAAAHFRCEDGNIIKLYQQAHIADPSGGGTQDTEARSAINSILATLENAGMLATS